MAQDEAALVSQLRRQLGDQGGTLSAADLDQLIELGTELVDRKLGTHAEDVPDAARDQAIVTVAATLYHQRTAPHGVAVFGDLDGSGTPIRTGRDPMARAWPILRPFLPGGFA